VLEQAGLADARVVILAGENDSATLLAATVVRDFAPDVPIIACAALEENVNRLQQGGADFALSVSQVAGQLLAHHILGKMVSQQAHIKLVKHPAAQLAGHHPLFTFPQPQTRIIKRLGQYSPDSFADWCRESAAPAVPGAKAFLDYATAQGVVVFYYSARREKLRDCTLQNLHKLQMPLTDESRLFLSNGLSKSAYRSKVAQQYRILLLLGDNMEDFVEGFKTRPAKRRSLAHDYANRWGRQWIILPNPMYGHWESCIYDFDYSLPRKEQLRFKLQELVE